MLAVLAAGGGLLLAGQVALLAGDLRGRVGWAAVALGGLLVLAGGAWWIGTAS